MTLTMTDLMPRVLKGAAWLDTQVPQWFNAVAVDALALDSCARCVLGQLFDNEDSFESGYGLGMKRLETDFDIPHYDMPKCARLSTEHGFGGVQGNEWNTLRECWVTVILERRAARVLGHGDSGSALRPTA